MNIHIALYRWKSTANNANILRALADIEGLAIKVPGIIEIVAAENQSKYSEGYSHVIFVRGEDKKAIAAYRAHPDHVRLAQEIDFMEERGIGVDFEFPTKQYLINLTDTAR